MGQYFTSLYQGEEVIVEKPIVPEPNTPNNKNAASLDPRSPTDGMVRTPLAFGTAAAAPAMTSLDPRSPTIGVDRTPVVPSTGYVRDDRVDEVCCRLSELNGSFSANDSMVAVCGSLENLSMDVKDLTLEDISDNILDSSYEESEDNLDKQDQWFVSVTEDSTPVVAGAASETMTSKISVKNISVHEDETASPKPEIERTPRMKPLSIISVNSPHRLVQRKQVANVNQKIANQISESPRKTNRSALKHGQLQIAEKENAAAL